MNKLKSAEEYLKQLFEEPFQLIEGTIDYDFYEVIKQCQKDTIDTVLELAAENSEIELKDKYLYAESYRSYKKYTIDKNSILNLKQQLLKEIE